MENIHPDKVQASVKRDILQKNSIEKSKSVYKNKFFYVARIPLS